MNNTGFFLRQRELPEPHLLATRLHVCAPETAFRLYPTLEMRHWCQQQPGILFPFGWLRFPGKFPQRYLGGLVNDGALFLFVPLRLYECRRHLLKTPCSLPCPARRKAGINIIQADNASNDGVCQEEACVRQVRYWMSFLAARQERARAGWRW